MSRLYLILLFGSLLSFHGLMAQKINREELLQKLETNVSDSVKYNCLRDIGYTYLPEDTSTALRYYRQCLELAYKNKRVDWESTMFNDIGTIYLNTSKYDQATNNYRIAIEKARKANDQLRKAKATGNMAKVFANLNQLDSAVHYTLESTKSFESLKDTLRLTICYNQLSFYYDKMGLSSSGLEFAKKAHQLSLISGNISTLAASYLSLSRSYNNIDDRDNTVRYADSAAYYVNRLTQSTDKAASYQNIAQMFFKNGNDQKAEQYIDSSLVYASRMGSPKVNLVCYTTKGNILLNRGSFNEAEKYFDLALPIAHEEKNWRNLFEIYNSKSKLAFAKAQYKEAYEFSAFAATYSDSAFSQELTMKVAALDAQYQIEKKEQEIQEMERQKEIQTIKAEQQIRLIYFFIGLAALAIIIAALLFTNQKRRNTISKQNEFLQQQKIKTLEKEQQLIALDGIIKGEENERSRMAKDLHDGLGSLLSGVKLSLSSMKGNVIISEEYANIFSSSIKQLDNAINEMRRVAHNMMPESLIKFGLVQAVQNFCDGLNESGTIHVHVERHNFAQRLAGDQEITAYRIIQELVNNALKHAEAKNIIIQLSRNGNIATLVVEDDGKGFDTNYLQTSIGAGYHNIQHRVNYMKGNMDLKSESGKGTSVLIEFPVD